MGMVINMKSKHLLLAIILVLSLSLVACKKDKTTTTQKQETTTIEDKTTTKEDVTTTKEANIQFYMEENVELLKYDRYTINYTLIGTDDAITWTSSDEGVATVAGGVINGIEEGHPQPVKLLWKYKVVQKQREKHFKTNEL